MPKRYKAQCEHCGKSYQGISSRFCSRTCYIKSKWIERVCQQCNKQFQARKIYVARGQMKYCSTQCARLASRKYPVIDFSEDTFYYQKAGGYYQSAKTGRKLHRVIWEYHYGPIPEGYIVHHRDGDTKCNMISNLELMEWGQHTANHNMQRVYYIQVKQQCSEIGCDRPVRARQLCAMHYQRVRAKERGYWL